MYNTTAFDQHKNIISEIFHQKYLVYLLFNYQVYGLWIRRVWFNWNILQAKLHLPVIS